MENENQDLVIENENEDENTEEKDTAAKLREEHQELLKAMVAEELAGMKASVDKAYKKLEEVTKENTRLKSEATDSKRKRLEDEGKHLEVANLRLAELEEKLRLTTEANTRLTRDREVERALGGLEFRNDFAKETAIDIIKKELIQDEEDGIWLHKSGASLSDFIKTFVKDPNKEFLFKPKETSGAGSPSAKGTLLKGKGRPKSLEGLSTEELLQLAQEGKLGSFAM